MGMLFTPAPARAMTLSDSGIGISCMSKLRTIAPSGFMISDAIS
jgi:hypothetical protein